MRRWDFEHKNAICIPNVPRVYDDDCLNYTLTAAAVAASLCKPDDASKECLFNIDHVSYEM